MTTKLAFFLFLLVFLGFCINGNSQSFRETVSSSGGQFNSQFEQIDFTVGEAVIDFHSDTSQKIQVTQGFQQPQFLISPIKPNSLCFYDMRLFPNPTLRYLNVEYAQGMEAQKIQCYIYQFDGSLVARFELSENSELDLETYRLNAFIIRFVDDQSNCQNSFKVIKL